MTARAQAQKKNESRHEVRMPNLRPVCRAIAILIATAGASNVHAGIVNLANVGAQLSAARSAAGPTGIANLGVGVSPQQALQASQPSIRDLANAAQAITQQIAAQQAAAAAGAAAPSSVPNGLATGGLQVAPGLSNNVTGNANLWYNANLPTQSVAGNGHVTVNVTQTGQDAVATWQTMNVGSNTTLNFDQSGGTQTNGANNWVILNRIMDPSGAPSQILGSITAQGTVLVINRNGILFGAGSQINVHSLVASSLDLLNTNDDETQTSSLALNINGVNGNLVQSAADIEASNNFFVTSGLAGTSAGTSSTTTVANGNPAEILGFGNNVSVTSASQFQAPGNITIAPGASITTSADGSASNGGFVLIAAPNVTNGGNITVAPTGQVILAAGIGVSLLPNTSTPQTLNPELTGKISLGTGAFAPDITPAGTLINTGIIQAARGNINLLGSNVVQNGVVGVTTSINTPGNITISTVDESIANSPSGVNYAQANTSNPAPVTSGGNGGDETNRAGQLIFGDGSVTAVLPDSDGETATASGTTFTTGSVTMTAGSVWFQSGSLIEAPGSNVTVGALTPSVALDRAPPGDTAVQGRIYVDDGATIDVSGLANVELPISDILLDVGTITENNLADSPLLRDSFLNGLSGVVVDSTLSGTTSDGLQWVGSPILNLAGAVNLIPRTIDQLLTNGGSITLSGNEVMTADGSSLNLNGGYIHYLGGMVDTTRLVDADGAIVPIGDASDNDTYVGVAGAFTETSSRWGVTQTWYNPLLSGGAYEGDYIVGGNAGTLNVFASQDAVLDGEITAEAFGGSKQVQGNDQPVGGTFNLGAATLAGGITLQVVTDGAANPASAGETGTVILQGSAPQLSDLSPNFGATTPLNTAALDALSDTDPDNVLATTVVPVNTLNSGGFANVSVTENGAPGPSLGQGIIVAAGTQLVVQPGGSIKLNNPGSDITVLGSLIAPSGTISISSGGNAAEVAGGIVVGPDAVISAAGQWVNNDTQAASGTMLGGTEYINGGSVTLSTNAEGPIVLQPGSIIDVSSGGEMQSNGTLLMQNGIPEGTGGSLSLLTNAGLDTALGTNGGGGSIGTIASPSAPLIQMNGTIESLGFAGGGTLTLQDLGFQIGGNQAQAPTWAEYLPASFFAQQGFGKYALNALYDVTVAPGATVLLTQQNLIPNAPALEQVASGADVLAGGLTTAGTLDPFQRQATDLAMTAGAFLIGPSGLPADASGAVTVGAGASIVGDAGATIGLGSPAQVTVLGSIIAPGGAITLSADSDNNGFALPGQVQQGTPGFAGYSSPSKSVWLGPDAVLDVAGVALVDPLAAPVRNGLQTFVPETGKVLPGGTVTISDDSGYVVAQAGALIDVSGTSATFDEQQPGGQYATQQVWSNAGAITLGASNGLYFDATLQAQPGAAGGQGGTLTLLPEQGSPVNAVGIPGGGTAYWVPASVVVLQQSGDLVPAGLSPGASISTAPTGVLQFSVDRLAGSGIATFVIGGEVGSSGIEDTVPIAFAGNVNLTVPGAVELNTAQLLALNGVQLKTLLATGGPEPKSTSKTPAISTMLAGEPGTAGATTTGPLTAIGTTVSINAPYVAIVGPELDGSAQLSPVEAAADATLNVNASFIDLENQVQLNNFGQANFVSSGDIRLTSTNALTTAGTNTLAAGELFTSGNLTFQAADLYPSTGSTFVLDAVGPATATGNPAPTTITFLSGGASSVPLSAGGTLLVDATDIVQSGTVRAPAGSLIFGVGDPTDTATKTQFNDLPLVATDSVTLGNGSLTSVSLDGATIPYGTTVDGVEWQFNPVANANSGPDVTAPPAKFVSVNGTDVSLNAGATVDLSGGGDLQAEEWVPGTGGTRNLLAQYNVSYATSSTGVATPTNVGASNVYAILPGKQAPVSAYDPIFAQTTQPEGANGTTTDSIGVGHAGLTDAVGESVYLSGVQGLAAGWYTLLPATYATLPGAFRVTLSSATGPVVPGSSQTLPDGTVVTAGYLGNSLTGSRNATPTLFDVQSAQVWQQYSQYTLTSANSFFPALAVSNGDVTPQLPIDAGQLVLAATTGLSLGATLNTAAAPGGAPAEVDIASQDIQITGNGQTPGEAALPGYLQISSDQLDALDAGSLLIGGIRTQTASGITIDAIANSVVVSNDAADPLTGPEIILVTKSASSSTDPNAANGLRVDSGSVITASGSYPAAKDQPITIGQNADSTTNTPAISGDGALLSVSNGGVSTVTRLDTTGTGLLTVGAGASLTGGQALTLDSSGNLSFNPTATLSGNTIAVDGSAITFTSQTGSAAAALPGFVVGPTQLAQLANAQQVILRSSGAMNFDGNVDVTFGNDVDLSAGTFVSDGGAVTINANEVALTNELGAPVPTGTAGSGTLTVNANEIDFGAGDKTVSGFGAATFNATGGIVGQGTGTFDFGSLPVTLAAPVFIADTASEQTIQTTGTLNLNGATGTALTLAPVGGALAFTGGTVNDNGATIEAPAGNVSLEATTGNLTVGSGSLVSSAGVSKQFFDLTEYAPGGAITLTADTGTVNVETGATLDFAGAKGGGAAGSLTLSAPDQTVQLAGTIEGNAAAGFAGGSFSLDTGGAVELDNLAAELASSGVNNSIAITTGAGNLTLSAGNTITAQNVSLNANGGAGGQDPSNGNIQILGTIDASGTAGGEIDLYGQGTVDIEGKLVATGSSPTERGGTVNIGTSGLPDTVGSVIQLDPTYGYEQVSSTNSGSIILGSGSSIDVSGGTAGGLSGGTVNFRAPLLVNGDVNITVTPGATITGSRATTLEAYAVWSTNDPLTYGAAKHFDGVVDPAGWYADTVEGQGQPNLVSGTFTDQSGNTITYTAGANGALGTLTSASGTTTATLAQLQSDLENDYFTPSTANADHETFYGYLNGDATAAVPGTLMGFVENFPINSAVTARFANVQNFAVTPGIELDNPNASINDGNISILTNWNLGAGSSPTDLAFRFNGQAPVITFRAENNVIVDATLTDGFFQIVNPVTKGVSDTLYVPSLSCPTSNLSCSFYDLALYNYNNLAEGEFAHKYAPNGGTLSYYGPNGPNPTYAGLDTAPVKLLPSGTQTQAEINEYYDLYTAYADFLLSPSVNGGSGIINVFEIAVQDKTFGRNGSTPPPTAPSALSQAQNPVLYLEYLYQYGLYLAGTATNLTVTPPVAPIPEPVAVIPPGTALPSGTTEISGGGTDVVYTSPSPTDNTPSPVATATNPLPLAFASLAGGTSSSYRLVAGANLNSANPLALQAAPASSTAGGDVTMGGYFGYVDSNNLTVLVPTTIRTGSGSIDIAAANSVSLYDPAYAGGTGQVVPGAIYTAGTPAADAPSVGTNASIATGGGSGNQDLVVAPSVNPDGAGNISIVAGNNITGVEDVTDATGAVTGTAGANISQFWWQWMEIGNPTNASGQITQTSIDFGAFDQGVMSVGGNVSVSAGGNISDLAVSLPTTWYQTSPTTETIVGGGNLNVTAGGNILSGDYFVANGTGTITAGGQIGSDFSVTNQFQEVAPVATLLATQAGVLDVVARQGADIGGVFDPSEIWDSAITNDYHAQVNGQGYSSGSAVTVEATTGDIDFETLGSLQFIGAGGLGDGSSELPATVSLAAFTGGITVASGASLTASATGDLNLIADQSISLYQQLDSTTLTLNMVGEDPSSVDETDPVRIYSLTGSIVDGTLEPAGSGQDSGFYDHLLSVDVDKPAFIEAGQDIVNLVFQGQNLRDDDVTRIVAGQDIYDTPLPPNANAATIPSLQLGGPGTFDVEAGRNIGPLTSQAEVYASLGSEYPVTVGVTTGIDAVGNANNPNLPHESANIQVLFGVGPGIDDADFISTYINPANTVAGIPSTTPALISFMEQYDAGNSVDTGLVANKPALQTLSASEAWSQFQALPSYVQQLFVEQVFFNILTDVGEDFNNPSSPYHNQYGRGYQAINTLFPASLGYTANNLGGGSNGANTLVDTGNLDIRSTTIQTQQGGNISILGPGGEALVGSTSAPPAIVSNTGLVVAGPSTQGILTLEQGDINIFTDQSLLLAQSRVFTEQGGDITIWSSNGNINAGEGSTTVADVPPPEYVCDINHFCTLDAKGEVTGAGIGTLQTIPGAPPGNANLLAPRGTVDAGAAGIRVSGNLNVAALQVLNVANIQVQGKATGIPVVAAVDTGALTAASAATSAVTQMAQNLVSNNASGVSQRQWVITVEVEGFGDSSGTSSDEDDSRKRRAK